MKRILMRLDDQRKIFGALILGTLLVAPVAIFLKGYNFPSEPRPWTETSTDLYLKVLERELLSGNVSRQAYLNSMAEKSMITGKAPLPPQAFAQLLELARPEEVEQLKNLATYYKSDSGECTKNNESKKLCSKIMGFYTDSEVD